MKTRTKDREIRLDKYAVDEDVHSQRIVYERNAGCLHAVLRRGRRRACKLMMSSLLDIASRNRIENFYKYTFI